MGPRQAARVPPPARQRHSDTQSTLHEPALGPPPSPTFLSCSLTLQGSGRLARAGSAASPLRRSCVFRGPPSPPPLSAGGQKKPISVLFSKNSHLHQGAPGCFLGGRVMSLRPRKPSCVTLAAGALLLPYWVSERGDRAAPGRGLAGRRLPVEYVLPFLGAGPSLAGPLGNTPRTDCKGPPWEPAAATWLWHLGPPGEGGLPPALGGASSSQ